MLVEVVDALLMPEASDRIFTVRATGDRLLATCRAVLVINDLEVLDRGGKDVAIQAYLRGVIPATARMHVVTPFRWVRALGT